MRSLPRTLLSVAGFDPSGGAGVLLDLRIFNRNGFHGTAVLTSLTVQNTRAVRSVRPLPAAFLLDQFEALTADLPIAGVKVGMLGSRRNIGAAALILGRAEEIPRVIDPVFRSSSGFWLLDRTSIPGYMAALRGKATLFTPNIPEAEWILGRRIKDVEGMKAAARRLHALVAAPCLLKGGHLRGRATDVLYDGRRFTLFPHPRLPGNARGTGCALSSSALCFLARGYSLPRACRAAVGQTLAGLSTARRLGGGAPLMTGFFRDSSSRR